MNQHRTRLPAGNEKRAKKRATNEMPGDKLSNFGHLKAHDEQLARLLLYLHVNPDQDFDAAKPLIRMAYEGLGAASARASDAGLGS